MTDVVAVRNAVKDLLGRKGDDTIREYIVAVLELGDYDFGRNGELAYDHFGQMLVSSLSWLDFKITLNVCITNS